MDAVAITNIVLSSLTLLAIWFGPMKALQKQRQLDEDRDRKDRQLKLFKALMTYRMTPMELPFIQALNLIDVEFDSDSEKGVRDAWRTLLELFSSQEMAKPENQARSRDLTAQLLVEMGKSLKYDFDRDHLERSAYYPVGRGWIEQQELALRTQVLELLNGKRRLPIGVFEEKFPDITLPPMAAKEGK
jgi:hypothetical protein